MKKRKYHKPEIVDSIIVLSGYDRRTVTIRQYLDNLSDLLESLEYYIKKGVYR